MPPTVWLPNGMNGHARRLKPIGPHVRVLLLNIQVFCSSANPLKKISLRQTRDDSSQVLEEVIVTATKRASNLQDVAVTVTALGAELLQAAQVNSAAEQTFVVPSLNVQRGGDGVHFITGL